MSDTPGMTGDPVLDAAGYLLSMRAVAGTLIANIDAALSVLGAGPPRPVSLEEPGTCRHPIDKRKDYTPNGTEAERWVCGVCGYKGGAW